MNRQQRRSFLKAVGVLPPLALTGAVGIAGLTSPKEAEATGPFYRIRKTEKPNSAPLLPAFPQQGCRLAGINVFRYFGTNNPFASSSDPLLPASSVNDGNRTGRAGAGSAPPTNSWWKSATPNAPPGTDWIQLGIPSAIGPAAQLKEVIVYSVQDDYTHPLEPNDVMTWTLYGAANFKLQGWAVNGTGGGWTTLATIRGNRKVKCRIPLANVNCGAVRVLFDSAPGYGGYNRVVEIEAFTVDQTVLPFRYASVADATADISRFNSWEQWFTDGFDLAALEREPEYLWDVIPESAIPSNAARWEFNAATMAGLSKGDPTVFNTWPADLLSDMDLTTLGRVLGIAGLTMFIFGIFTRNTLTSTMGALMVAFAIAIGIYWLLTKNDPTLWGEPIPKEVEPREIPPRFYRGGGENFNFFIGTGAYTLKRAIVEVKIY